MNEYVIVKIGDRHEINGEFFSQDVIEIYPLDDFTFCRDMANEVYRYIKGVDIDLKGAFPILEFLDGVYLGCVAVMGIIDNEDGTPKVVLTCDPEPVKLADAYCRDAYEEPRSKVEQWSRLMEICETNDLLERVVDFVNLELEY